MGGLIINQNKQGRSDCAPTLVRTKYSLVHAAKGDYNTNMNLPRKPIPVLEDLPTLPEDPGKSKP
ncbi:MAG: hypothetical protein A2X25_14805 [Chloroflexi bacterium GWB2_49_20]|nr:MAG: hypothetical protein A2X25_14805 [Chloroflexi bacterium GWB2_49_20]OGN79180.1 MAG: hypothetical protein A2X26_03655 [Chloroflexi bacterium GWC2_49_37]OGN83563.1 MAG: hypothetical protein A2X27_11430 [Chloroflexi bacterium GWD2_49_16]HCC78710.1 hypothetical protein [Anaerolineae bacterium]